MNMGRACPAVGLMAVLLSAGCRTVAQPVEMPAVLTAPSALCQQQLTQALAGQLGAPVTAGDNAFLTSSELLLEHRPPREPLGPLKDGNLTGRPASFHLLKRGQQCLLQYQQQEQRTALPACSCQAQARP